MQVASTPSDPLDEDEVAAELSEGEGPERSPRPKPPAKSPGPKRPSTEGEERAFEFKEETYEVTKLPGHMTAGREIGWAQCDRCGQWASVEDGYRCAAPEA